MDRRGRSWDSSQRLEVSPPVLKVRALSDGTMLESMNDCAFASDDPEKEWRESPSPRLPMVSSVVRKGSGQGCCYDRCSSLTWGRLSSKL